MAFFPSPFSVRVVPHYEGSDYWVVQYRRAGWCSAWQNLTEAYVWQATHPRHWTLNFPCLCDSLIEAVRFAQTMTDEAAVDLWLERQRVLFEEAMAKATATPPATVVTPISEVKVV